MTRRPATPAPRAEGAGRSRRLWNLVPRLSSAPILLLALAFLGAAPQPAVAQGVWLSRARLSLSVGAQFDTLRLSESLTLTKYVEPAPLSARVPSAAVPLFDLGLSVRLAGNLGAAVSVSTLTSTEEADVTARIPHPFYFNQARHIAGTVSGVKHREVATHTNLVYLLVFPRFDVAASGGASFFRVEQSVVSDVVFAEAFPYDTASFVNATLTTHHESAVGYNAGVDFVWKVTRRWGVGGMIRYAHASVPFAVEWTNGDPDAGGLQAGGGVRITF